MKFGICLQALIPQRKEGKESSEMVNQLLLGDHYEVLSFNEKWVEIKTTQDAYQGFIDAKCHFELNERSYQEWVNTPKICVKTLSQININDEIHWVSPGSHLPAKPLEWFMHDYKPESMEWEAIARQFLNTPYLWGGKNIFGIDCSGFTQSVAYTQNINLLRDAYQQAEQGGACRQKNGALAFFTNEKKRVTHVGIVLDNSKIIHASGKVRIDTLTDLGILNADTNTITHTLSHFQCIGL